MKRSNKKTKAKRAGGKKDAIEYLWAPWRLEYILDEKDGPLSSGPKACVFCGRQKKDQEPEADRRDLILGRAKYCFTILNKYPYANGHLMIVPYEHTGDFNNIRTEVLSEMMTLSQKAVQILTRTLGAAGFNIGMNLGNVAGAGIPGHIHIHVVPRWVGDSNFMPIIGHTRVLPEYIEKTYDRLVGAFSDA